MIATLLALSQGWFDGVIVPFPDVPMQITEVAFGYNYATVKDSSYGFATIMDCVSMKNQSAKTIAMTRISFNLVNPDGSTKKRTLSFNHRQNVPPGGVLTIENNCYPGGYYQATSLEPVVGWVAHVDFADGTSWNSPGGDDLSRDIAHAVDAN